MHNLNRNCIREDRKQLWTDQEVDEKSFLGFLDGRA